MRRSVRPEVPSTAGGRPRTRVCRFRFRDAVTCVSATNPALAIPSPVAPPAALSRCRRLLRARPPSLPTVRLAMFTRDAGERFSGSDGRPTTSATSLPTHGHTLEHPFPAKIRASRVCGDPEPTLAPTALFTAPWPSPVEEGSRRLRAVTTPPGPTRLRCKHARERATLNATVRSRRRLRATPRSDHRLRRWPWNGNAGLHGPSSPERRTSPPAACCRRTTRAKVPLLVRATRAPLFRRRVFERRAG